MGMSQVALKSTHVRTPPGPRKHLRPKRVNKQTANWIVWIISLNIVLYFPQKKESLAGLEQHKRWPFW